MRSLHNPGKIIQSVLKPVTKLLGIDPPKAQVPVVAPVGQSNAGTSPTGTPTQTANIEATRAQEEQQAAAAKEEQRVQAGKRTGTAASLLSPPTDVSLLNTRKRTLGSS